MMNDKLLHLLRDVAVDVARREDAELKTLGLTGIFEMPELAYAYHVGKELAHRLKVAAPDAKATWQREVGDGRQGITDLLLSTNGIQLRVEFKMAATRHAYIADAKKLMAIEEECDRALCLVVDAWRTSGANDERIAAVENELAGSLERVGELYSFETGSPRYKKDMACVIGVWRVSGSDTQSS
jgi:hypothetical protein